MLGVLSALIEAERLINRRFSPVESIVEASANYIVGEPDIVADKKSVDVIEIIRSQIHVEILNLPSPVRRPKSSAFDAGTHCPANIGPRTAERACH